MLVGTDFGGDGKSLTDSGYPRVVKSWKRGTPIEEAEVHLHRMCIQNVNHFLEISLFPPTNARIRSRFRVWCAGFRV